MRAAVPAWRGSARRGDVGVRGYFGTSVPWPWGGPKGRVRGSSPFGLFSLSFAFFSFLFSLHRVIP